MVEEQVGNLTLVQKHSHLLQAALDGTGLYTTSYPGP